MTRHHAERKGEEGEGQGQIKKANDEDSRRRRRRSSSSNDDVLF